MKKLRNNKLLSILWKLIKALAGAIVAFVLIVIITQRVFNNDSSFFGYRIFTVATGSMEPDYKIGDMLLVKDQEPSDIKIGDDLVYLGAEDSYQGKVITHRVIDIKEENGQFNFHTKGIIEMAMEDPVVNESQIYGTVVYNLLFFSLVNKVISSSLGFILLIVLPVAVLILLEIIDIKDKRESLKNEETNE